MEDQIRWNLHSFSFLFRISIAILAEISRFSIYPSSQPPGQQIPIGNNTGSLPDLSNVHFPSPLHTPLDQEDHSSSTPFSNVSLSDRLSHTIDYIMTFSLFLSARSYTHFTRGCTFLNESLSLFYSDISLFFLNYYFFLIFFLSIFDSLGESICQTTSQAIAYYRIVCASANNTINTHLLSARVYTHRYIPPRDFARVK